MVYLQTLDTIFSHLNAQYVHMKEKKKRKNNEYDWEIIPNSAP